MFLNKCFNLITVSTIILCVSGCAKYTPHPYQVPKQNNAITIKTDHNQIVVRAKNLGEYECKQYFSRAILRKGYQPVQLYIKNNTDHTFILDTKNINMQIESPYFVAKKLHLNETRRFITWAIPGLFFWPFLIPALVETVLAIDANRELDDDFQQRVFGPYHSITIRPNSQINKVMFVAQEYFSSKLQLKLLNKETREVLEYTLHI